MSLNNIAMEYIEIRFTFNFFLSTINPSVPNICPYFTSADLMKLFDFVKESGWKKFQS